MRDDGSRAPAPSPRAEAGGGSVVLLVAGPEVPDADAWRERLDKLVPVGVTSVVVSGGVSIAAYFGLLGSWIQPYSPLLAAGLAVAVTVAMAVATGGRWYLRRIDDGIELPHFDEHGNPVDDELHCCVTDAPFERPDMIASAQRGPDGEVLCISSLALSTDRTGEHVLPADEHAHLGARASRRLRGK